MYRATDAALIRAAAYPSGLALPAWPDPTDPPQQWLRWLREAWALPGFAAAVTHASPALADQTARALAGEPLTDRRLVRLIHSTLRYVLRWTGRATPFGRFAGVAPIDVGRRASVRWGGAHREVAVPDGAFVGEQVARAEKHLAVLRSLSVVANSLGYRRDRVWVMPCARVAGDHVYHVEIDLTEPVRLALDAASTPIPFSRLSACMVERLGASAAAADQLLTGLIDAGALISQARPPITVTDPAAYLALHVDVPEAGDRIGLDLRVDCSVTLPPAVVREACGAAATLVRVAPRLPGWTEYHHAFIERWGPGAAVPLREVLNVLGYPAGYRGSTRHEPAPFTKRDALLGELAQRTALDNGAEVVLDDALIDTLRGDDDRPPLPHTELRFALAADTPRQLDNGEFTLTVVSGARHAGVGAGRFLHLLDFDEVQRFREVYRALPTATAQAEVVQLSAPVLDRRLDPLVRTPQILPILPVGDFHPDPSWTLADLAVAGDSRQLWLASRTTGQPVEPLLLNSVNLATGQQPLVRFLTEIWTAFTAPCAPFALGPRPHPAVPAARAPGTIHPSPRPLDHHRSPTSPARSHLATLDRFLETPAGTAASARAKSSSVVATYGCASTWTSQPTCGCCVTTSTGTGRPPSRRRPVPPAGSADGRPNCSSPWSATNGTSQHLPRPARPATTVQHRPGTRQVVGRTARRKPRARPRPPRHQPRPAAGRGVVPALPRPAAPPAASDPARLLRRVRRRGRPDRRAGGTPGRGRSPRGLQPGHLSPRDPPRRRRDPRRRPRPCSPPTRAPPWPGWPETARRPPPPA